MHRTRHFESHSEPTLQVDNAEADYLNSKLLNPESYLEYASTFHILHIVQPKILNLYLGEKKTYFGEKNNTFYPYFS